MNLAQVIEPDTELPLQGGGRDGDLPTWLYPGRGRPRLVPENAYQPNRPRQAAPAPEPTVRVHHAPEREERRCEGSVRRALRKGGREVMAALRGSPTVLSFTQLCQKLPHVSARTLHVRLSTMVSRGDVQRTGEFRSYRYTATEAST